MIDHYLQEEDQAACHSSSSEPSKLATLAPLAPMHDTAGHTQTPMHNVEAGSSTSPAWDPLSEAPLTITDADIEPPWWLSHENFNGVRVQLVERGGDPFRRMEFKHTRDGSVTVQDRMQCRTLPLARVIPILANRKEDALVCFAEGDHFGKLFKVKTFGSKHCLVRPFGTKSGKGEKLFTLETSTLAVVYPPNSATAVRR